MIKDLIRYPKYRDNYLRAFDRMIKQNKADGLTRHEKYYDAYTCMMWWVGDNPLQTRFETPEYLKGAVQL